MKFTVNILLIKNISTFFCKELLEEAYHQKILENKQACEERTAKKRAKRLKKKDKRKKKLKNENSIIENSESQESYLESSSDDEK